jgi:agmatine/peptidylarginine deiminase
MIRPIPDWKLDKMVVLAMPGTQNPNPQRVAIVQDYALFLLEHKIPVRVLLSSYLPWDVFDGIQKAGAEIDNIVANDIWIRDWAPLLCDNDGERVAIKFDYKNSYAFNTAYDDQAGVLLPRSLDYKILFSKLIWDMGNFTTNGSDIIVTDQVLAENGLKNGVELKNQLEQNHGFAPDTRVFVLPCLSEEQELWELYGKPKEEAISHIDGNMRFLDDKKIICALPNVDRLAQHLNNKANKPSDPIRAKQQKYMEIHISKRRKIESLIKTLKEDFEVLTIESDMDIPKFDQKSTAQETLDDIGDYINFLRFGDRLFLPQYDPAMYKKDDKAALTVYRKAGIKVTPVKEDFILQLARAGGVLNCASWVM